MDGEDYGNHRNGSIYFPDKRIDNIYIHGWLENPLYIFCRKQKNTNVWFVVFDEEEEKKT